MSASNCPETARQKMIGMMYLFYTAMLALNVSKDILHAFVVVNSGLEATNLNFEKKNAFMYSALENARANDPVKVEPYYQAAQKAKKYADAMKEYIQELRTTLYEHLGVPADSAKHWTVEKLEKKDDYDTPTHFFVGSGDNGGRGHKATELKNKLEDYRKKLLDLLKDPKIKMPNKQQRIKQLGDLGIDTKDPKKGIENPEEATWENSKFYHMPAAAAFTVLSQIENQVINAEATVVNELLGNIGATDFKFDTLAAKVVPKSNYVVVGDKYEADLFVAAFSTTSNPTILVGEGYDSATGKLTGKIDTVPVERGIGKLVIPATSVGVHHYAAVIKVKNPSTGEVKTYPLITNGKYGAEYICAKPTAVISPTKMNVLYIGVDNPISISVSGFADNQVFARISQGSLRKVKPGQYIARVRKPGKAYISVSVKDDKGNSRSMGKQEFRVKRVPDPVPMVAGKRGGYIKKSVLLSQVGIKAELPNFDFDLKFVVKSFTVSATIEGFERSKKSNSYRFTPAQLSLIKKVRPGGKVYIENVVAVGPDGKPRKLGTIALRLK